MTRRLRVALILLLAVSLVGGALVLGSPATDRAVLVETMGTASSGSHQGQSTIDYDALPSAARTVVDEARRTGYATVWAYEDHEALAALDGVDAVRLQDHVLSLRIESADGSTLFGGILFDLALAAGGLLLATAVSGARRTETRIALAGFPIAGALVVLGVNALLAPDPSLVPWFGLAAFGTAAGTPVLVGYAARDRNILAGIGALSTLVAAVAMLGPSSSGSALFVLAPLVVFGVPGALLGGLLADYGQARLRRKSRLASS